MAHNLSKNKDGKYAYASTLVKAEKSWHGLGTYVDKAMTAEEAITLANLDYEVEKQKIFIETPEKVEIPDRFATYRTDTKQPLGIVGNRYTVVQNREAFGFFDSIIDKGEAIFETAGALGNGEKIFVTAKLPDDIMVGGEKIESYLLLFNSHDGYSSLIAGLTEIRVVCNNTLQAALRKLNNKISISHTQSARDKISEAYRIMGLASQYNTVVGEVFNRMTDKKLTEEQYKKYFFDVLKPEYPVGDRNEKEISTRLMNTVDLTYKFSQTHPTQMTSEAQGTLWGAYNAISGYYNYCQEYKSGEEKFNTQFFGNANKKMLKSFSIAEEMLLS